MQTPGSEISILLAVGTPSTGSGNLYCQWELSPGREVLAADLIYQIPKGDEEENDYLAPADSTDVALPAVNHASSAMETGPFETDESATTPPPHLAYRVTARIAAAAKLGEPVRDDLYMLVDTVERGEVSTPAAKDVGYGITYAWDDLGEAMASYTAWAQSMDASDAACSEVIELPTQTQLTIALGCIQILEAARVPAHPEVKEAQEKDKIESKPDKNGKRVEAGKSQKQL
nr:hypothetical protein [Tanacetum cinerariifolium]